MDHEYLQNVMGSPYVQEGAFSRLKAKGAQAMGALGAMAGHQIQSPQETQLRSLWEGFMSSLKKAMKDWEGQVSPMFDGKVSLNQNQQLTKDTLDGLARTLSSLGPQKIGSAHDRIHNPDVRNQRDNPETYVKGSAYNRSTTSPTKLKELAPDLEEGFWDAAKRDMGLNKALGSNDPSTILDAYKKHVLAIFQNFMKDAVKVTKMTAQKIYATLAKMQPSKSGWQAAGNMQKVIQQLQTLQQVGDLKGQGAPPVLNPPADGGTPPQQAPQAPQEPQQQPQQPAQQQKPTDPSSGQAGAPSGGTFEITPQELPHIILKAIKIIINAVSSDTAHSGKYFSTPQLPTQWGGPSITKEIHAYPKPKGGAGGDETGGEEPVVGSNDFKHIKGKFLYNFHGDFSKHPGKTGFSINVEPVGMTKEVEGLPGVSIEVWWRNTGRENKIYVVAEKNGQKSKPTLIMNFFDHQVNSKVGATDENPDQNPKTQFTIDKIVGASDPNAPNKLDSATPQVKAEIDKHTDQLLRSLMATTGRKSMEFKSKTDKVFHLKFDDKGNVTSDKTHSKSDGTAWTMKEVKKILNGQIEGQDPDAWKESLDYVNYFKEFEIDKPKDMSEYPAFQDAVIEMQKSGSIEKEAIKLVSAAWMKLRTQVDDLTKITAQELVDLASNPAAAPLPQSYTDAMKALVKLGWKEPVANKALHKAWADLTAIKDESEITADELTQAVVSGKKPKAVPAPLGKQPPLEPPSTPVSKPPGGPAPTTDPSAAPVSKPPGGPAPTTDPSAPVSDKGKEDATKQAKGQPPVQYSNVPGKDVPQQSQGEPKKKKATQPIQIWKGEDGQMRWQNPKGAVGALNSKTVAKLKSNPDFLQALKNAKASGFKAPDKNLQEKFINPFQKDNFLLNNY